MKKVATIILCIFITSIALSQQEYEEVVYLKNGSVIKGVIIEQVPNVSIKIQTKDGNIFVYRMEEIDRITKESIQPFIQAEDVVTYGVHQHDGFFLRLTGGPSYGQSLIDTDPERELSGFGSAFRIQMGGTIGQDLILYGEAAGIVLSDPNYYRDGIKKTLATDTQITMSDIGAGITYYFMPSNFYLSFSGLLSRTYVRRPGVKGTTDVGFGLALYFGKEWWVSDDWALGVAAFGYFGQMTDQEPTYGEAPTFSNTGIGILFSATYN